VNLIKNLYHRNKIFNFLGRVLINKKNYLFKSYSRECNKRSELDIFDVRNLSKNMDMYLEDTSPDGALYGIIHWIKKFADIDQIINFNIEHGVYLGDLVRDESLNSIYKGTITFSKYRKKILDKNNKKKNIAIGPYIHYANDYYSKDVINKIKRKNNETLVFFPPHSIKGYKADYNKKKIYDRLDEYKSNYETIMVCLYYKDVNKKLVSYLSNRGFKVVSAGHIYDFNFLSRLKSIINLSDHTVSMSVGTHIGYCIYLDKSHEIISYNKNKFNENNRSFNIVKDEDIKKRGREYQIKFKNDEKEIISHFFNAGNLINNNQLKICNKFWGFDQIKTKDELNRLLLKF